MTRNIRKILALLMTLTMLTGMMPAAALAEAIEAAREEVIAPEAVIEEIIEMPEEEPTEAPTEEPAEEPAEAPTEEPAEEPAEAPTEVPAEEPTKEPTEEPAPELTIEPTIEPTLEPGEILPEEPSGSLTEIPGGDPDPDPTSTPEPVPEVYLTLTGMDQITVGKSATYSARNEANAIVRAAQLSWTSSDTDIATVRAGVVTAKAVGTVTITASKGERSGSYEIEVLPRADSVVILMDGEELPNKHSHIANYTESKTLQLQAKTMPEEASDAVTWRSGNARVARVNGDGLVTFVGFGTATIAAVARDGSGKQASLNITVRRFATGITVTGRDYVASGKQLALRAAVSPANASVKTVDWSTSDENAAVINARGMLTAKAVEAPTAVTVTARAKDGSGIAGQHTLTVYPAATAVEILKEGEDAGASIIMDSALKELRLSARVLSEHAYQGVTWKSSDARVARISADGLLTVVRPGKAVISATANDGSGKRDLLTVTIRRFVNEIRISGSDFVASGRQLALRAAVYPANATLRTVTWTSSNPDAAVINARGILTARAVDVPTAVTVTATANDGSGIAGSHTLTVYPAVTAVEILKDEADAGRSLIIDTAAPEVQLSAKVLSEHAYQKIAWRSSNTRIVSVSADGLVTALRPGAATITATAQDGSGKRDSIAVTVRRFVTEIKVSGKEMLASGKQLALKAAVYPANATLRTFSWISSNPDVAVINARGIVTARAVEEPTPVTITAAARDGSEVVGVHTVWVYPAAASVEIQKDGQDAGKTAIIDFDNQPTLKLTAAIAPEKASQDVVWRSSDARVATVENGLVTAKKPGAVTITATANDGTGKRDAITVTVRRFVREITLSAPTAVIAPGRTAIIRAAIAPADATLKTLQWTSSDPSVATVNARGIVTAATGLNRITPVTITATAKDGSGVYGEAQVFVGKDGTVYRALLIGNTYPDTDNYLPGPDNDVRGMKKMLGRQVKTRYDVTIRENVTGSQMESAIYDAFENADANDVSLFYYSGHGSSDGSLVGIGGSYVSVDDLRSYLDKIPGTKIVLLDSCYSGAHINRSAYSRSAGAEEAVTKADLDEFNDAVISAFSAPGKTSFYSRGNLRSNGYYVITACSKREESQSVTFDGYEIPEEDCRYVGAFTFALCYGSGWDLVNETNCAFLADTNLVEGDSNGKIDFWEAYRYAYDLANRIAYQSAQYYCGEDFDNQYVLWSYK